MMQADRPPLPHIHEAQWRPGVSGVFPAPPSPVAGDGGSARRASGGATTTTKNVEPVVKDTTEDDG